VASAFAGRRTLRRIPNLRGLTSRELDAAQDRMVYRSYPAGDVIWRTHGPLRFSGYIESGEIDLEFRVDGVPVRSTRLHTGSPLPPPALHSRRLHDMVIARAVTDVRIGFVPETRRVQSLSGTSGSRWVNWLWPVMLLLLVLVLGRDDLARITSGLFYLAATPGDNASSPSPGSMRLLRAAQKVDGGAGFAFNEQGYRWYRQNRLPDAADAFTQAVDRDPGNAPALNNLAITYFAQGNYVQAAGYLRRAVDQAPDNPVTPYNLGITLMQLKDPSGALREFREAGFIDPKAVPPLVQQAYLYQQEGEYANAEQRARTAIQLNPSLAQAHLLLGMALYNQGREADALASFKDALTLEPGNRVAAFYQALILGHLKQYDLALPILHDLLISSPDGSQTFRILAEIDALYRLKAESATAGR